VMKSLKSTLPLIAVIAIVMSAGCAGLAGDRGGPTTTVDNQSEANSSGSLKSTSTQVTTSSPETTTTSTQTPESSASTTVTAVPSQTQRPPSTPTSTVPPNETIEPNPQTPSSTSTSIPTHTVTVQAADDGTSEYKLYASGDFELRTNTENTDKIVGSSPNHVEGITGDNSKDVFTVRGEPPGSSDLVNNGDATLELYVDGELVGTVNPDESSSDDSTDMASETDTPEDTETPTETETSTPTPTETETTVNRENMQVVKVKALERKEASYEFVSSGTVRLSSDTDSSARVDGTKGSGTVSEFKVDTFLIPEGEDVIEVRNINRNSAIRVTVDGKEIEVSDGPDVDKSNFKSNRTITIKAVGGERAEYDFYVTGDPFLTDESDDSSEAVYPDRVTPGYAQGSVGDGGTDSFKYTGRMESFTNFGDGAVEVYIDGKLIATLEDGGSLYTEDIPEDG